MATLDWQPLLAELISANTISSADPALDHGNRAAAERLADRLEHAGFECMLKPLPGRDDKVNLIARVGPEPADAVPEGLVLAGHLDTVPCDDTGWHSDPFTLTERDECLFGLGSSDMKGFIALAAAAAAEYADRRLAAPVSLLVSADEECGMDGARTLADAGDPPPGRFCVIGEPTGLRPIRRHKGILMETIETRGASGHSSNPAHGANAIDAMHRVIAALHAFREALAARGRAADFPVPHATLNTGVIRGGDAANRIPARCRLDIDLRFPPGETIDALRTELHARVNDALADSDCTVAFSTLFTGTPAFETAADSPIVVACEAATGYSAGAVDFGTEGAFYNAMGMQSVVLGPGDIAVAHQPDEHLPRARVAPMQRILHTLIADFCRPA